MVSQRELAQVVEQINEEFNRLRQGIKKLDSQLQGCLQELATLNSKSSVVPGQGTAATTKTTRKQEKD